ncbi:MAG TPA: AtzG-like protein [Burkholderiaceae bacterium]
MDEAQALAYVKASATALGVPLDSARAVRVAAHLQRTAALAAVLQGAELAPHDELSEIYSPGAFWPALDINC